MTSSAASTIRNALSKINPISATGFAAHNSTFYDRVRPSYPASVLEQIQKELTKGAVEKDLNLLELGSGTGIFTRLVVSPPEGYPSFSIKRLTCLEPSDGMRDTFNASLPSTASTHVECLEGSFSDFPSQVADSSVDGCVIAQAFHWAHPDYEGPIARIAQALKPGAPLILVWNMEDRSAPWVDQLRTAYEKHESGSPQYRLLLWHALFSAPSYASNFLPPQHTFHTYSNPSTPTACIDRALSKSYTSVLPGDEKKALSDELRAVLERGEGMAVLKEAEGEEEKVFEYPYKTEVVVMIRR